MKRVTLAFAFLCAGCALTFAGPEEMSSKEVMPPPVVESCCFAGWYFGVHGGATFSNFDQREFADEESLGARGFGFVQANQGSDGDEGGSAHGGLHLGYNWCRGHWVFGFEGDLSATALDQNDDAVAEVFLPNNTDRAFSTAVNAKSTIDWFSTFRPRVGFTLGDHVMFFLTGGIAVGNPELRERTVIFAFRDENPSIDRNQGFDEDRGIKVGWTGGGGVDFCVSQHVTLSFTYLYVDLEDSHAGNDISFVSDDIPRSFDTHTRASSDNNFHVFQGGVSLHY